ncbi:hypothetical protein PHLGIDRAFT_123946 [Phlebiopsis gigantea 11061_1 CR5-6]|uniref:MYND-type domain-containing protein n=1 Tax=Phlebiopsis gigantea (strain 11061_1 CR5-6) TaxID=745531 RepID=A0A0C3SFY6_PHLG1|nr:hypothetical protein PHLGIDRAFT_123946 [Phlebiopsis gigantea 11061_1 CR5-6]
MSRLTSTPLERWGLSEYNEALPYAHLRMTCFSPISNEDDSDLGVQVEMHVRNLLDKDITAVRLGTIVRNPEDILELALRCCAGVTTAKDDAAALELLMQLAHIANPLNASRPVRARAWALIAHIEFERRLDDEDPDCWNVDSLYRAAVCANEACTLGYVCPGTMSVGMAIERSGFRRQEDCKFPEQDTKRFEELTALWRAVDRRKAEIRLADRKMEKKLKKDPRAYICTADGCGIEATHKAALLRCAGKCAAAGKPAYCSKDCQRKDWRRHKPFCGEAAPIDEHAASMRQTLIDTSPSEELVDVTTSRTTDRDTEGPRDEIKFTLGPGADSQSTSPSSGSALLETGD